MRYVVEMGKTTSNKIPEDFISFIKENIEYIEETGCWNWTKTRLISGYGRTTFYGEKALVHRISYWAFIDNLFAVNNNRNEYICHTCDNPSCCNPDHLFLGDSMINSEDFFIKHEGAPRPETRRREMQKIRREKHKNGLPYDNRFTNYRYGEKSKDYIVNYPKTVDIEKIKNIDFNLEL